QLWEALEDESPRLTSLEPQGETAPPPRTWLVAVVVRCERIGQRASKVLGVETCDLVAQL
ncbi:hypothetical protein ADL26_19180, partial [Thermoactinomyces vulgaris]